MEKNDKILNDIVSGKGLPPLPKQENSVSNKWSSGKKASSGTRIDRFSFREKPQNDKKKEM